MGGKMTFNSISYDLYVSLNDALTGGFTEAPELPEGLFDKLGELTVNPRQQEVYRIIKVVSAPPATE